MKAFIFAAGKGERMLPLTLTTPKPLLKVAGKNLIQWHLEKFATLGIKEIFINTSHLADRFEPELGNGERWGLKIHFLYEGPEPLETGGGLVNARQLLGEQAFILVNGDVWSDYDFKNLPRQIKQLAHLVMVDPPAEKKVGDFYLDANGKLHTSGSPLLTYSGIGMYRAEILDGWQQHVPVKHAENGKPIFKLAPILNAAIQRGLVTGSYHSGAWTDVGSPERLALLNQSLSF